MTREVQDYLADLIENADEGVAFDAAVSGIARKCDVSEHRARQLAATYCETQERAGTTYLIAIETADVSARAEPPEAPSPEVTGDSEEEEAAADKAAIESFDEAQDALKRGDLNALARPAGAPTGEYYEPAPGRDTPLPVLADVDHPLVPEEDVYIKREMEGNTLDVENLAYYLADDEPVLSIGETGVGKDEMIRHICAQTNRPMVRVNFGSGTTYNDLVGEFVPSGGDADDVVQQVRELEDKYGDEFETGDLIQMLGVEDQFSFKPGILYLAVVYGWTFVADEMNAAGPDAMMPLHGVTEDDPFLSVPATSEVIKALPEDEEWRPEEHLGEYVHPEFQFVGTMNPPHYPGVQALNDAFKSRFWPMEVDYLAPEGEKQLLYAACRYFDPADEEWKPVFDRDDATDEETLDALTEMAATLRESYRAMDIVTPVSHRDLIKVGKECARMDVNSAAHSVLKTMADPSDTEAISKAIDNRRFPDRTPNLKREEGA